MHELRKDPVDGKKIKALRLLARKIVDAALDGDMSAMKEIDDRLDGRPTQAIAGDDNASGISVIHRVIVDAAKHSDG